MEPIISPWIFYWIEVMESLKAFAHFVSIFTFCLSFAPVIIFIAIEIEGGDSNKKHKEIYQKAKKIGKIFLPITLILFTINIFIPSRETVYQMLIAKYITPDNLIFFKGEAVNLIDYIINQIKMLKN